MTKIIRNGNYISISGGGTINITDGNILVDGKPLDELNVSDVNEKEINITIQGEVDHIDIDYCNRITVNGNVKRVKTNQGDIDITGDVDGDVHTNMGDITCGNIKGDCHTNMGNIRRRYDVEQK